MTTGWSSILPKPPIEYSRQDFVAILSYAEDLLRKHGKAIIYQNSRIDDLTARIDQLSVFVPTAYQLVPATPGEEFETSTILGQSDDITQAVKVLGALIKDLDSKGLLTPTPSITPS